MSTEVKESRTAVLGIRATESERKAANFVASAKGIDVSSLLRRMSLEDVVAEAERMREMLGISAAA